MEAVSTELFSCLATASVCLVLIARRNVADNINSKINHASVAREAE